MLQRGGATGTGAPLSAADFSDNNLADGDCSPRSATDAAATGSRLALMGELPASGAVALSASTGVRRVRSRALV